MRRPNLDKTDTLPPCCGEHAYEEGEECTMPRPSTRYEGGDCFDWCNYLVHHLHPCKCGSDTVTIPEAGILECEHCGYSEAGNNYDLLCHAWNETNPPGKFHPYVDGCP